jgi:hypothetical protein
VTPTPAEQKILIDLFARNRQLGINGVGVKEMLQFTRDPRCNWL